MKIGKVQAALRPTQVAGCLAKQSFLIVQTQDGCIAAADQVGAAVGDRVLLIAGAAASRFCMDAPIDAAVVAVLCPEQPQ